MDGEFHHLPEYDLHGNHRGGYRGREFAGGTIKLLLIRPWSRGKILLSKFTALILFGLLCAGITAVVGIAMSSLLFSGNTGLSGGFEGSSMNNSLLLLLTDTTQALVISLIAFMLSTVFRSGGLAIGLSLLVLFTKDIFGFIFNPGGLHGRSTYSFSTPT